MPKSAKAKTPAQKVDRYLGQSALPLDIPALPKALGTQAASRTKWKGTELAYLAAFIDGEGTICVFADKRWSGSNIRLSAYNSHVGVLLWIRERFGGAVREVKRNRQNWKPAFIWELSGKRIAPVLMACLPYLIVKREQAQLLLAVNATVRLNKKGIPRGSVKIPPDIIDFRAKAAERMSFLNKGERRANDTKG